MASGPETDAAVAASVPVPRIEHTSNPPREWRRSPQ